MLFDEVIVEYHQRNRRGNHPYYVNSHLGVVVRAKLRLPVEEDVEDGAKVCKVAQDDDQLRDVMRCLQGVVRQVR